MRNAIDMQLEKLRVEGRKGLMTHVVVGYPSLDATVPLVAAMEEAGADFVELQIPFSDPLADGPVILGACETALANDTKVRDAFAAATKLSKKVKIPLLFMGYANTVYQYGVDKFCEVAAAAGISGLIIPDMPLEAAEREGLLQGCRKYGLHNIITLAPSSTPERLSLNSATASGFAYCMGYQGITGGQIDVNEGTRRYLAGVREHIAVPLALGFGITNREQLLAAQEHADIAVVGSALISRLKDVKPADAPAAAKQFLNELLGRA